jgi:murein DD-endopeptidase MepM/ murein hydrolase activator NlpD
MRFKEFKVTEAGPLDDYYDKVFGWGKNTTDVGFDQVAGSSLSAPSGPAQMGNNGKLPVKGPITSPFGMRARGMHNGTDFGVPVGTPVSCPDDGVVFQAGQAGSAGIMVTVNCGNVQHRFMHLSQLKVKPGDQVKAGQVIGLSGNTGLSTGPHVHWEKIVAGNKIDPMKGVA